jgi:threonyl-tRNA synthetase
MVPERMNAKIRNAQKEKYPYMLVIGDRENGRGASRPAPSEWRESRCHERG